MKFTIAPADLKEAVRFALTAMAARPTSPIMGGVLLTAADNELVASGSDYSRVASLGVPADIATPGETLLNGQLLGKAVGKFRSSKPVQVSVEGKEAHLAQGKVKFSLNVMPAEDYPRDLVGNAKPIGRVSGESFAHLIRNAGASIARDDTVEILTNARLELGQQIEVMSTDRYRLSLGEIDWEPAHEMQHSLTVDGDWIRSVGKTVAGETELFIGENPNSGEVNRFGITSGAYSTSVSLTAGDYPKIRSLFKNTERAHIHRFNRQELIEAIDAASVMLDPKVPVLFESAGGRTSISGGGDQGGSEVAVSSDDSEPFRIGVNPSNILDILRVTDSETISFAPNGPKPIWIAAEDGETNHLVMPVRLTAANTI
ncbi:DNA polymerase III subunit beta [Glutamicibacter arilaitensis]|uniref:DNA polymerase III subunit beta n=1 Tax=Glutamicibacter arilaitensis TaxID=256701 RepID=UPI003FD63197